MNYTFPCRSTIHLWIQKASWAPYEWYGVLVWGHWYLRMMTNPTPTILRFWEYQLLFIYKIGENLHFWENIHSCACPLPEKQCIFRVFAVCQPVATQFYVTRWSPGYRKIFRPLCFCFFSVGILYLCETTPKNSSLPSSPPSAPSSSAFWHILQNYGHILYILHNYRHILYFLQNWITFRPKLYIFPAGGRFDPQRWENEDYWPNFGDLCISRSIHLHIPIKAAHPCHHKSS